MQTIFETSDEMAMHLAALRAIAEADGIVTNEEALYLENLGSIYKARFPSLAGSTADAAGKSLPVLLQAIKNPRNKLVFLQDLLSMASIDGAISSEEIAKIEEIADTIGLERARVERLFSLNRELLDANTRLSEFLFAN